MKLIFYAIVISVFIVWAIWLIGSLIARVLYVMFGLALLSVMFRIILSNDGYEMGSRRLK